MFEYKRFVFLVRKLCAKLDVTEIPVSKSVTTMQEAVSEVMELCYYRRIHTEEPTNAELIFDMICAIRYLSQVVHCKEHASNFDDGTSIVGNEEFEMRPAEVDAKAYAYLFMTHYLEKNDTLEKFPPKIRFAAMYEGYKMMMSKEFVNDFEKPEFSMYKYYKQHLEYNKTHRRKWVPTKDGMEKLCYNPSKEDIERMIEASRFDDDYDSDYIWTDQYEKEMEEMRDQILKPKAIRPRRDL